MVSPSIKVVIPARYGSSRLPAKPLLRIRNKPIFWHVAQRVQEAGINLEDIIVATDHEKIQQVAVELCLPVIMTSIKHVSGTDRVNEVVKEMAWDDDTLIINVQGDEPLIPSLLIKELIRFAKLNPHFDITTVATEITEYNDFTDFNVVKAVVSESKQALYFTRSPAPLNRDAPHDLTNAKRHIGIYVYKASVLNMLCSLPESELERIEKLEQLRALSNGLTIGVMNYIGNIPHGIDTEQDYINVKTLME